MSTQAKNRILSIFILFSLLVIISGCIQNRPQGEGYSEVFIPSESPSVVVVSDADTFEQQQFDCLRLNIYHEAGNQSRRGMEAVALVTVNRAKTKHFPDTVCGVVHQAVVVNGEVKRNMCQFSWYCDGKPDLPNLTQPADRKAWDAAGEVAKATLTGEVDDFLGRATHYHATYVRPAFARVPSRYRQLTQVGSHIFYRDIKLSLKA